VEPLGGRLVRGAIDGVVAGLVFAGVTMWFADSTGGKAEMPLRMISTIVKGDQAMAAGTTSPALGAVVHLALSALFGILFALAVPRFRTNGTVALAGTVYGLLYVLNFLVLTPLVFTTFRMANQPFEVVAHLVFGTLLSFAFFGSGARRGEPVLAIQRRSAGALS
jgi:uncharacterized membrane protein YagU involved in acid resistance